MFKNRKTYILIGVAVVLLVLKQFKILDSEVWNLLFSLDALGIVAMIRLAISDDKKSRKIKLDC
jgi:hypothetical protein